MKVSQSSIARAVSFIVMLLILLLVPNTANSLYISGLIMMAMSVYAIIYYKDCGNLVWVIGICGICNISWAISSCLTYGGNSASAWQKSIYDTEAYIIMSKCLVLFFGSMILGIGTNIAQLGNIDKLSLLRERAQKRNNIVYYGGLILLLYILVFGFIRGTTSSSGYASQTNPLYEYALVIFIYVWYYTSPKNKLHSVILIIYGVLYFFQGLFSGDRSSAFPMILVLIILLRKRKMNIFAIMFVGLIGILFGNFIDLYRNNNLVSIGAQLRETGLTVNTLTYSHFAGVQIIRFGENQIHLEHMLRYLLGTFVGSTQALSVTARLGGFVNAGGGFSASYFYYWLGYLGVATGGILFGVIIRIVFSKKEFKYSILEMCIICFTLRWYIYYPIALLRSALFVPMIIGLFCDLIDKRIKFGVISLSE